MPRRFTVEWAEPALLDAEANVDYLVAEGSSRAAVPLVDKIAAKTARLEKLAGRGRIVPELRREGIHNYRELIMKPYRMVYRINGKLVVIVAFVDGRRDLGELLVARAMR
jgi:toxin ParE1/3/4